MQCDDILQILFQRGLDVPPKLVNASIVEINFKLKLPGLPPLNWMCNSRTFPGPFQANSRTFYILIRNTMLKSFIIPYILIQQ